MWATRPEPAPLPFLCVALQRFLKLVERFCEVLNQSMTQSGLFLNDFDHNLKVDDESVFLILKVNRGPKVTYSQMTLSKDEEHMCNSSTSSQTCKEIL